MISLFYEWNAQKVVFFLMRDALDDAMLNIPVD
jgi:hypothetical protein